MFPDYLSVSYDYASTINPSLYKYPTVIFQLFILCCQICYLCLELFHSLHFFVPLVETCSAINPIGLVLKLFFIISLTVFCCPWLYKYNNIENK